MKVTKFLHTSIPTMPYDKSYDFYTRILGLNMAPRPDVPGMPGAWLGVEGHSDETQVHIIGCDPLGKQFEPTQVHFALQVESLDDAIKTLDSEGVSYEVITGLVGTRQLFMRDPAGNQIELQEPS